MTWMQVGVAVAAAGVLVTAWLGLWPLMDRRFGELRTAIDKANESNDTAHAGLGTRIDGVRTELHNDNAALRTELSGVAANVNILVGRQQERDAKPPDSRSPASSQPPRPFCPTRERALTGRLRSARPPVSNACREEV